MKAKINNKELIIFEYTKSELKKLEKLLTYEKNKYDTQGEHEKLFDINKDNQLITYWGLYELLKKEFKIELVEVINCPNKFSTDIKLNEISDTILEGITLYKFQKFCAYKCINNKFGSVISATGSGKSEIILTIIQTLLQTKRIQNNICLVMPNVTLAEQFVSRAIKRGVSRDIIGAYHGTEKTYNKQIIVFVINSLYQNFVKKNPKLLEFLDNVDLTIFDECFHYDTLILTNKGWKKIGKLYETNRKYYKIASYNFEKQEIEYKPLGERYKHKRKNKMLRVTVQDENNKIRTLIVTETHKFPDLDGNYKEINKFQISDELYCTDIYENYFHDYCSCCGKKINPKSKGGHMGQCLYPEKSIESGKKLSAILKSKSKEERKAIHTKAMKKRSANKDYCKYLSDRMMGDKNPVTRLGIKEKISETIKQNIKLGKQTPFGRKDFYEYTKWEKQFQEMRPDLSHEVVFGTGYKNPYGSSWFKADFVDDKKLIIYEINGEHHYKNKKRIETDERKKKFFISKGFSVISYTNQEVEAMYAEFKKM